MMKDIVTNYLLDLVGNVGFATTRYVDLGSKGVVKFHPRFDPFLNILFWHFTNSFS